MLSTHSEELVRCRSTERAVRASSPSSRGSPTSSSSPLEPSDQSTKTPQLASLREAALRSRPPGNKALVSSSGPLPTHPAAVYTCSRGSGGERVGAGGQRTLRPDAGRPPADAERLGDTAGGPALPAVSMGDEQTAREGISDGSALKLAACALSEGCIG